MNKIKMRRILGITAFIIICSSVLNGSTYTLTTGGEQVSFEAVPELGYVTETSNKKYSFMAAAGSPLKDVAHAPQLSSRAISNIWMLENDGSATLNREAVTRLRGDSSISYAAPMFSVNGEAVGVIPEVVVKAAMGFGREDVQVICEQLNLAIIKPLEFTTQEYLLKVLGRDAATVFAAVQELEKLPGVEWAWPNTLIKLRLCRQVGGGVIPIAAQEKIETQPDPNQSSVFPNDEYFQRQWHLYNTGQLGGTPGADIRAPEAWEITTGDPNVVVAVVDTGVDLNHPDLRNNLIGGYDFLQNDNDPSPELVADLDHHGTFCAGLIAAQGNNNVGVAGVTWHCSIMPIRVSNSSDWISLAKMGEAFRWAASNGADILSNSWIIENNSPIFNSALEDVTDQGGIGREGRGCVVLFSAGPFGIHPNFLSNRYQSAHPRVIAVGAIDDNDVLLEYSAYGPDLDVLAPGAPYPSFLPWYIPGREGAPIWTTAISGSLDYENFGGTSAAAPIAAGVVSLILSIEPDLTAEEVRYFLSRSAKDLGDPGRDNDHGWGRVDARAALDMVLAKRADLNNDWQIDEADEALLLDAINANDLSADIAPAKKRDDIVDANDLALLRQYLGTEMPEPSLLAHWKLDETEGMFAYDSVAQNDGIVLGNPVWQPEGGQVNGALEFDGIDDVIIVDPVLNPEDGPFSVFAWIKGGVPGQAILSQQSGVNWLQADVNGALMTELKKSGGRTAGIPLYSETVITDGNWHRVGFVWDGSQRTLYVDGNVVAEDTLPNLAGVSKGLQIGASNNLEADSFWFGMIDDVRIYDRAVTP